jgi:hypothetical protein
MLYITYKNKSIYYARKENCIIFNYCNKNIDISDEMIRENEKTQSKFSNRTIDYLLKINDGNENMTPDEIKRLVEDSMKEELEFEK